MPVIVLCVRAESTSIPWWRNSDFYQLPTQVPLELQSWPKPGLRRVSVNCFGFGGTNAHAIVDEGDYYVTQYRLANNAGLATMQTQEGPQETKQARLFVLSSPDKAGVLRISKALEEHLLAENLDGLQYSLDDLKYTLACRRSQFEWRASIVAHTRDELISKLQKLAKTDICRSRVNKRRKISFIFCGQGAQWVAMGRDLMSFAPFRQSMDAAASYLRDELGHQGDLLEDIATDRVNEPQISQPATTALQVALVDLFKACGIEPESVVGHSSGEIAAAYACGMISREAAWSIAFHRGHYATIVQETSPIQGSMCFLGASGADAQAYLTRVRKAHTVQIACINSHRSVTLSGNQPDIEWIVQNARDSQLLALKLKVKVAYHSRYMDTIKAEYRASLQGLTSSKLPPTAEMFSSVTGERVSQRDLGPDYWADNLTNPVRFSDAINSMLSGSKPDIVLEISPHRTLRVPFEDNIEVASSKSAQVLYVPAMNRNYSSVSTVLQALGSLWAHGLPVDMSRVIGR